MTEETQSVAPVTPAAGVPTPPNPMPDDGRISIEEFMRVDIRVARIVAAERVPKSKKLVRLDVDLGDERRTLVAGIAEAYEADALVGRVVPIVANLRPATLMGIQSNGMILAANQPGILPILLGFEKEPPLGARVK